MAIHTGKFLLYSFLSLMVYEVAVYLFFRFKGEDGTKVSKNELRISKESRRQKSSSGKARPSHDHSNKDPNSWESLIDYHPKGNGCDIQGEQETVREINKSTRDEETQSLLDELYASDDVMTKKDVICEKEADTCEESRVVEEPSEEKTVSAVPLENGETVRKALSDFDFSNMVDL
ncbi:MAG: hypothetical protein MJZ14_02595 [Paludibacteraceae bacterium]|nr:hypothetical protein [Paludibacteraceae bacterium]